MKFTSSQSYYTINRSYHSTTGWSNIFSILGYKDSRSKLTGHTRSYHSMSILKYVVCQLAHIGIHKPEVKTAPSWSWPTHLHLIPMVKMAEAIPSVGHMPSWRAEWGLWITTNQPATHEPKFGPPCSKRHSKAPRTLSKLKSDIQTSTTTGLNQILLQVNISARPEKKLVHKISYSDRHHLTVVKGMIRQKSLSLSPSSTTLNGGGRFTDVCIQDISCQNLGVVNGTHFRFLSRHCRPFETLQYLQIRVGIRHCRLFRNPYLVTIHCTLSSCSDLQLPTWNRVIK